MRRTRTSTLKVCGPFSLKAALDSLDALAPNDGEPGVYAGRHVIGGRPVTVQLHQTGERRLALAVSAEDAVAKADLDAGEQLVRRMFGLDLDAERFYSETGGDDRVLRRLQSHLRGVRPVTAPTPLAALAFIVLADEHGAERARMVVGRLNGAEEAVDLAALDPYADAPRLGVSPAMVERLCRLGDRGLFGAFGADLLRSMPLDAARNWVCAHAEVGIATADLVLMAGAGRADVVPKASPQLLSALERYYGVAHSEARRRLDELGQRWGEFSSWAVFLLLEAWRLDVRAA